MVLDFSLYIFLSLRLFKIWTSNHAKYFNGSAKENLVTERSIYGTYELMTKHLDSWEGGLVLKKNLPIVDVMNR